MARTPKSKQQLPGPQAPPGVWTPAALSEALARGTLDEKIQLLRTIGILDKKGELAGKYRSWGTKVTRTSEEAWSPPAAPAHPPPWEAPGKMPQARRVQGKRGR